VPQRFDLDPDVDARNTRSNIRGDRDRDNNDTGISPPAFAGDEQTREYEFRELL
jgi:hypothetical protein